MPLEHTPHTPAAEPGTPDFFLEVARRFGERLAAAAEWEGDGCTWTVMSPDRDNPESRTAVAAKAGPGIYEGTAGIALFLAELHAAAPSAALERAALGGIARALAEIGQFGDTSYGFHGGKVGVAYAAARVGHLLGRPELARTAEELLRPMEGKEDQDRGLDVIAGGGGSIPALLRMTAWGVDRALAEGIARRLGEQLIAGAERETAGWAWGTMRGSSIRHLCGYAHGSAGIGHGLLELYHATGDGAFRYGAEQAFLYEQRLYSPENGNWPDMRHTEIGEYLFANRYDELRDKVRRGQGPAPQPLRFMSAWCHGGPGIGLARLRAWQLLGDEQYLAQARDALRATEASLEDERMNYSLCHGRMGNAETFVFAAEVLGDSGLLEVPRRVALQGWETYERTGTPWPCGTLGGVPDPGLLLGEAGIGYAFLRLARPETPSVLVLTVDAPGAPASAERYEEQRRRVVEENFTRTLKVFEALGVDTAPLVGTRAPGAAPSVSDAEAVYDAILARIAAEGDPVLRERMEDAFQVDRARFELARANQDFTEEFLESLARFGEDEVRWEEARIELSPRARLVHGGYDWEAWLEQGGAEAGEPQPQDVFILLQAMQSRVTARRLSPFAALVLNSVEEPATLDDVVGQVAEAVTAPGGGPDRGWLEDRVVEQLRQAYRAGFVSAESGAVAAAA